MNFLSESYGKQPTETRPFGRFPRFTEIDQTQLKLYDPKTGHAFKAKLGKLKFAKRVLFVCLEMVTGVVCVWMIKGLLRILSFNLF